MSDHDDFAFEPMPGLPARPPEGETVLWQGRPGTLPLAIQAYGMGWMLGYFALLTAWRGSVGFGEAGFAGAIAYGLPYMILGLIGAGVLLALAFAQARNTVYTITSARVVMRIGAALSVTVNLPFAQLASAGLDVRRDGSGTIAMQMKPGSQLSWLVCWPHVRPWRARTEPALRCVPDAARVAAILSEAAETRIAVPRVERVSATAIAAE
jgi:hypothetical protein